ncbi:MAG: fumarate hydratase [Actinomycetota bacterium]|nr:fumarate hydratase [Actinomycetota bacterium]
MRILSAKSLGKTIESLCIEISSILGEDVLRALEEALEAEKSSRGKSVLRMIIENAKVAKELGLPICQDTGFFTVFLDLGIDTCVDGDFLEEAKTAVSRATRMCALRSSLVRDPLGERKNTGDNTPPLVVISKGSERESRLGVMAKGGGSEMACRISMLPPGAGWDGVLCFVMETLKRVGAQACPPLVLGLGVGGSFERAALLSKRALLTPLGKNVDEELSKREQELVELANELGFGPGALGGTASCIGARILSEPCHMATLPVALNISCHALRRKLVSI